MAVADLGKAVHNFNSPNVLGLLVAELLRDAQAQGRPVADRQSLAVKPVGEDRLLMTGPDEIDALVVTGAATERAAAQRVVAVEHDIARGRLDACTVEDTRQLHAGPLADAAPALDAVMAGGLGAGGHPPPLCGGG